MGDCRIRVGGTLGALLLGVLMDRLNPFRVLAVSYALGAVCIVMIGLSENGLWLMALAILVPASVLAVPSRAECSDGDAVPHPKSGDGRELVERHWTLRAIVGSLSGGMMMALNFSFDTLFLSLLFRRLSAR